MAGAGRKAVAMRFGENLRRFRMRRGLSQEDVAYDAGLHRTEIGLLERGERVPRIDTVAKLAAALSASPGSLMDGITEPAPARKGGRRGVARRRDKRGG
jgi:transcriptional regulator with XRE-family HTH domain